PARKPVDLLPMSEHRAPIGCHGPNCSKVPTPAPSPQAPPTLRVLVDETLFVSTGDSLVPPTFQSVPADSTDGEVVRRAADVYHPPLYPPGPCPAPDRVAGAGGARARSPSM